MTQRRLVFAFAWAILCLPALAQQRRPSEVQRLRKQVAELEKRVAALERMAVRFAAEPKPEAADPHGYYADKRELDDDERVPGVDWLRKVPGVVYAKLRTLPHLTDHTATADILSRVAKGTLHPADPLAYTCGFRFGDRVLSVNGVLVDELPRRQRLSDELRTALGVAVLVKRKGKHLLLAFRIAPPGHVEPRAPELPPTDLAEHFTLVMASVASDGKNSTVILQAQATGRSVTLGIGDRLSGYRVLSIEVRGKGDERVAEVTLLTHEGPETIRLTRAKSD